MRTKILTCQGAFRVAIEFIACCRDFYCLNWIRSTCQGAFAKARFVLSLPRFLIARTARAHPTRDPRAPIDAETLF
ncbi:MAG: hypothetical protein DCC52_06235 [Chloroflexi bacterium]|nr:MAG: hypothetical protein DCC52_06235 [Chloroflexota bacterium]